MFELNDFRVLIENITLMIYDHLKRYWWQEYHLSHSATGKEKN